MNKESRNGNGSPMLTATGRFWRIPESVPTFGLDCAEAGEILVP